MGMTVSKESCIIGPGIILPSSTRKEHFLTLRIAHAATAPQAASRRLRAVRWLVRDALRQSWWRIEAEPLSGVTGWGFLAGGIMSWTLALSLSGIPSGVAALNGWADLGLSAVLLLVTELVKRSRGRQEERPREDA